MRESGRDNLTLDSSPNARMAFGSTANFTYSFLENWQGLEHAIASNNTVKEIE